MLVKFKAYENSNFASCLNLFDSNSQVYFSTDERADFENFLQHLENNSHYYVGFIQDHLIACGGWDLQDSQCYLRWGIIDRHTHNTGLGTQLLKFRIAQIYRLEGRIDIAIKTSGQAHGFFAKHGFFTDSIVTDGLAPGIDQYNMILTADAG